MTRNAVDDYIAAQSAEARPLLESIRKVVKEVAPEAEEVIGYGLPSYKVGGKYMLHFGAAKHHIGLYATPHGHARFEKELSTYKQGKGSVQFPFNQPIPLELIRRIAEYRANQLRKDA